MLILVIVAACGIILAWPLAVSWGYRRGERQVIRQLVAEEELARTRMTFRDRVELPGIQRAVSLVSSRLSDRDRRALSYGRHVGGPTSRGPLGLD
jgi:hypothetical protein